MAFQYGRFEEILGRETSKLSKAHFTIYIVLSPVDFGNNFDLNAVPNFLEII